jgi:hypothetical protein
MIGGGGTFDKWTTNTTGKLILKQCNIQKNYKDDA